MIRAPIIAIAWLILAATAEAGETLTLSCGDAGVECTMDSGPVCKDGEVQVNNFDGRGWICAKPTIALTASDMIKAAAIMRFETRSEDGTIAQAIGLAASLLEDCAKAIELGVKSDKCEALR